MKLTWQPFLSCTFLAFLLLENFRCSWNLVSYTLFISINKQWRMMDWIVKLHFTIRLNADRVTIGNPRYIVYLSNIQGQDQGNRGIKGCDLGQQGIRPSALVMYLYICSINNVKVQVWFITYHKYSRCPIMFIAAQIALFHKKWNVGKKKCTSLIAERSSATQRPSVCCCLT